MLRVGLLLRGTLAPIWVVSVTTTNVARMQETRRCTLCARAYEPKSPQQVTCGREACVRANERQVARAYKSDPKAKAERQRRDRERKAASYEPRRTLHPTLELFFPIWHDVQLTAQEQGIEPALRLAAARTALCRNDAAAKTILWACRYRLQEAKELHAQAHRRKVGL